MRDRLASYLNKLIGYGVSGFRVDAAKHVGQTDLDAIYSRLHRTADGTRPYWALEVFGGGPGSLAPEAFTSSGDVLGLDGVKQLRDAFKSYPADHVGQHRDAEGLRCGSGLTAGSKTLSFVQNHDTERNGDALSYKDGATNTLATQYLLASGYGTPAGLLGVPVRHQRRLAAGDRRRPDHRHRLQRALDLLRPRPGRPRPGDAGTTGWAPRRGATGATTARTSSRSAAAAAGWRSTTTRPRSRSPCRPGLHRGRYCDLVTGHRTASGCTGTTVVVDSAGRTTLSVPAKGAVAVTRRR